MKQIIMKVSIIVAADQQNGIGKNNELLCYLPDDLKYFKRITSGHCIVMGRKTYESIGRLLPNRTNIIVTTNTNYKIEGAVMAHSLPQAIDYAKQTGETELMITGGGTIYKEALDLVDKVYLTRIQHVFEADTFFPELKAEVFKLTSSEVHEADDKHPFAFAFEVWERSH